MPYGTIKVDTVTFTDAGVDKSVSISGLVQNPTFSGNITVTGTVSGSVIQGGTLVSGATVTGTTANFTSGNFINISGGTYTITSGVFASGTAANPSVTFVGDTDTGLFASAANQVSITTSGTERLRVDAAGQIEAVSLGSASAPVYSFTTDPNTGIYSPGADQLAISTNGTGRLFVNASGNVSIGSSVNPDGRALRVFGGVEFDGSSFSLLRFKSSGITIGNIGQADYVVTGGPSDGLGVNSQSSLVFGSGGGTERMRLDSSGRLGLGSSSPGANIEVSSSATDFTGLILNNTSTNGRRYNIVSAGSAAYFDVAAGSLGIRDLTAGATRVVIDSSGRCGIGVTGPTATLHVVGTSAIIQKSGDASNPRLVFEPVSGGPQKITGYGDGDTTEQQLAFCTGAAGDERARIDSSGRLLVGTSSSIAGSNAENLQVVTNAGISRFAANASPSFLGFYKSRSSTVGTNTAVQSGDAVGQIDFYAADGSSYLGAAQIKAEIDGTPGANDMPGRLVFFTTADGASSPTERMRINSSGRIFGYTGGLDITRTVNSAAATASFINSSATTANQYGLYVRLDGDPNAAGQYFLQCVGNATVRAEIRSDGGLANYSANNVNLSDRNAKKDITPAEGTWDCLKEWEIVNFRYKDQSEGSDLNMGVIAQQIAESCPEVITVFQEATEDQPERLGVKDQQMMWMAIKALQEAQLRIETLEAKVAALEGV